MFSLRINTPITALVTVLAVAVTVVMGQIAVQGTAVKPIDGIKRKNNMVIFISSKGKRIQLPEYKTTRHKTGKGWDRVIFEMTHLSENNQYAVYTKKDYADTLMHGMMKETITLLDAYGQKKWSKDLYYISDGKINETDPNAEYVMVWLSNNGRMVLATYLDYDTSYHMQAYVLILENTGQELYRSKIREPYIEDYRRDDLRLVKINLWSCTKVIDTELKREKTVYPREYRIDLLDSGKVMLKGKVYNTISDLPDTIH